MKTKISSIQALGIILFTVSIVIYHLTSTTNRNSPTIFLINYIIAAFFFLLSFGDIKKGTKVYRISIPKLNWHILLSILAVSCFTLNRSIQVFSNIPLWLEIVLFLSLIAYMTIAIPIKLPVAFKNVVSFLSGISLLVFLYYTIILIPYTPFAIIGLFLLGISSHLLIPILLLSTSIKALTKKLPNISLKTVLIGSATATLFILIYIGVYTYHQKKIESSILNIVLNENHELPEWVSYAQNCQTEFWTKRIIGHNLLFDVFKESWWDFGFTTGSYSELKVHDPLVAISAFVNKPNTLGRKERIKIISSTTHSRHYSYEKLWSGKDLQQSKKLTDIRIYPEYRMAYAELTLWINNKNEWENNQQEALLSFQLPEGAVASSLSLWINGIEEKSRLTTRKKASNAYKTIVGREMRDPVVLHWQEGNKLTATIFPCTPKEPRRVKLGITIPLTKLDDQLILNNIIVQGPDNSHLDETIHLKIIGDVKNIHLPHPFKTKGKNQFLYDGSALSNWTCQMDAPTLSTKAFYFNNKSFQVAPIYYGSYFQPQSIYLDINQSWSISMIKEILTKADNRPVFVYNNKLIKLTEDNFEKITIDLLTKSFSLFPIDKISSQDALLICMGDVNSPVPSDLEGSSFHKDLISYVGNHNKPIKTIVINGKKSSYISTLEQFKCLECENISLRNLKEKNINNWFKTYKRQGNSITLPMSETQVISRNNTSNTEPSTEAPSHLLRLFNYHSIIQNAGHLFLQKDVTIPDHIYELCNEAFIVTPISSLIVLETTDDYNRFNIDKNKNSLKNASLNDSGAVPEPGEWALIITIVSVLILSYFKLKR